MVRTSDLWFMSAREPVPQQQDEEIPFVASYVSAKRRPTRMLACDNHIERAQVKRVRNTIFGLFCHGRLHHPMLPDSRGTIAEHHY